MQYGVDAEGLIDYDALFRLAQEHRPRMLVAGFPPIRATWISPAARDRRQRRRLAVRRHRARGRPVAAGLYPNPVPYADIVTTTTHKTLRGPRGGLIMGRANPDIEKKIASMVFPGIQGGPLMHVIAAKAVAFKEAQQADFAGYQRQVLANARAMAATFQDRGYKIVSGGTDNHLLLVDLTGKSLTGKDADAALGQPASP